MSLKLIASSIFLICLQHVFNSAVPFCFFIVAYLALKPFLVLNIFGVWLLGFFLDLSIGVHIGASAFSFLTAYILLSQLRRFISFESKPKLFMFSLAGLSIQHFAYTFALSFVLTDSFAMLGGSEFFYFALLAVPFALMLPKKRW